MCRACVDDESASLACAERLPDYLRRQHLFGELTETQLASGYGSRCRALGRERSICRLTVATDGGVVDIETNHLDCCADGQIRVDDDDDLGERVRRARHESAEYGDRQGNEC